MHNLGNDLVLVLGASLIVLGLLSFPKHRYNDILFVVIGSVLIVISLT